ncbi:beta-ketoacyl synthase N-terminal-like domain-containing protein [Nonomuraea sp. NPDC050790]|uniref:beta-ketoacyl synthase N-terminal-like domain-containing protein n=1 Tax=Nonomuraea sp. NPDC050790 TaxID=3364371 RepID=UPI0037913304
MSDHLGEPSPDDIAVVGVGCRFPGGVRTMEDLWRVLLDGVDVLDTVPGDRWSDAFHSTDQKQPGTMYADQSGLLADIDRFDAGFFGISPREAAEMDPQQRMLLEVAAEAMEDSGLPRHRWEGSRTSVHVGLLGSDYMLLHAKTLGVEGIDQYFASGKESSFAAGRIAYAFGLRGPSMAVSTACSSSLSAVHLACRALRDGEADTALAGGANALITPELSVFMSKARALSPTGRCRPFDAAADGIARSEGCAVVVLKRYGDAVRDHDHVHGIILGSAMNHDGQSAGLTVPSAVAQQELLRQALVSAGVGADVPAYVEAHGTGTPLGDPLELSALAEVLGKGRPPGSPLLVGSLKANFGHMDATAGVAGLLKALLVARHRVVPRQIHFDAPTPMIDWVAGGLAVPGRNLPLTGPAVTGVSAFGLSGTNVHVVVRAPQPAEPPATPGPAAPGALLLSATTAEGLRALAADHSEALGEDPGELSGRLTAAAVRRTHHVHRLAVAGSDAAELRAGLAAFLDGREHDAVSVGSIRPADLPVVYAFSGHGAQWPGVGTDLYQHDAVFREALDECDAELRPHSGWALLDVLRDPGPAALRATVTGQPALFALQIALARSWSAWGVRPDAVIGHSMGEIAAACVAGAMTLSEAARLIVERSQALERAKGTGAMASIDMGAGRVRERLAEWGLEVSVAAVNGPRSVVVSGPVEQVAEAVRRMKAEGGTAVELSVEYPSHGPLMLPYGRELRRSVAPLRTSEPAIPMLSTVDAEGAPAALDEAYWERNLCSPVLFWPAVDRLLAERDAVFVEIGAHPVLSRPLRDALARRGRQGMVVSSLARGESGPAMLARSRADLHVAGVGVDWARGWDGPVATVALPPPRWAGTRFWLAGVPRGVQSTAPATPRTPVAAAGAAPEAGHKDIRAAVHEQLAQVLGHPEGTRFPETRGLFELGLDSIGLMDFAERLQTVAGQPVEAADVLAHASVAALTGHLLSLMDTEPEAAPAAEPAFTGPEPVAVVGLACRVPGARDAEAFWTLLSERRDAIGPVPPARWDADRLFDAGATATTMGGFLESVDGFDHGFFRVSPREARSMDPQQRLFLEVAWEALEHAGLPAEDLRDSRTGVFVGLNSTDYQQLVLSGDAEVDLYYGTGNSFSGSAGRLSYLLGLRGPSLAVDTACSSSLTAVHLACQSLRAGESEVAVAGGANVMVTPTIFRAMSAAGALSRDGRCKTFDDSADGYGRGEGAGAVVLKRLSDARRDGDQVLAVIRGSAVNQDGASGGLTVPSGVAQQEVIGDALRQAGLEAAQVDYVEAHGTGTRLGDAVELRALATALCAGRSAARPLLVGSVKTNIGHLEAAAGIVGLIKVVLALGHGRIPAHLHFDLPTRQFAWERLPLRVPGEAVPWNGEGGARVAGVSAFGFTGTNAHVVLQEPPAASPRPARPDRAMTLAVSARTEQALDEAVARMRERLAATPEEELADLCWTSLVRRTHHEHRIAVVGSSAGELADRLAEPRHRGHVPAGEARPVRFHLHSAAPDATWYAQAERLLPGLGIERIWERTRDELRATDVPGAEELAGHLAAVEVWRTLGVTPAEVSADPGPGTYATGGLPPKEAARALAAGTPPRGRNGAEGADLVLGLGPGGCTVSGEDPGPGPLDVMAALHVRGARIDWDLTAHPGRRVVPLPRYPWQRARHWVDAVVAVPEVVAEAAAGVPAEETPLTRLVRATPAPLREEILLPPLLDLVADVLGGADDIDPDQGFFGMGMDSVLSLRLKAATEAALGTTLPNTVVFECPTPRSFARFIVAELSGEADDLAGLSDEALAARVSGVLANSASALGGS